MAWRGSIIVLLAWLPACAAENPLFGYGVLESNDSEGDADASADDDADDADDADDVDDDDDDDDTGQNPPTVCNGAAPREFGLVLEIGLEYCNGEVLWDCNLDHDQEWLLTDCCEAEGGCDTLLPSVSLEFQARNPDLAFAGDAVQFHAFLNGTVDSCRATWVEIVSGSAPIPLYAGANTYGPRFDHISVAYNEPGEDDVCACSDSNETCCDRPAGPYQLAFNLPSFADMFPGVILGQGEVWDEQIADWGHPYIEVFSAFRDSGCQQDLKVDWFLALQTE